MAVVTAIIKYKWITALQWPSTTSDYFPSHGIGTSRITLQTFAGQTASALPKRKQWITRTFWKFFSSRGEQKTVTAQVRSLTCFKQADTGAGQGHWPSSHHRRPVEEKRRCSASVGTTPCAGGGSQQWPSQADRRRAVAQSRWAQRM